MTVMTCVIVEDEPMARQLLEEYIKKVPSLKLSGSFSSPIAALDQISKNPPDVLFLDVQMPEITGINLLKILKPKMAVVLTTAYSEYAIESYELDVTDYLLKPITLERFLKSVEKIKERIDFSIQSDQTTAYSTVNTETSKNQLDKSFFFVKDGTRQVKINHEDILYIEGLKDYVAIHTKDRKITSLINLKTLDATLPTDQFIRVHNSFIVSVQGISSIQRDFVEVNQKMIPISDTYRKQFKTFVEKLQLK